MLFTAASYLAFTVGMISALMQQDWRVAQGFLVVSCAYTVLSMLVTLVQAVTAPGIPPIAWLYFITRVLETSYPARLSRLRPG